MARIYISVGSNIDRERNLRFAYRMLAERFDELRVSRVYESEAIGFDGEPFFNLVIGCHTQLDVAAVVDELKAIERLAGRDTDAAKFSSRTLDLDLLLYDERVLDSPVKLPRAEILYNAFVLQPLAELAATERHPQAKKTYAELWQEFPQQKQKLWPIEFDWAAG